MKGKYSSSVLKEQARRSTIEAVSRTHNEPSRPAEASHKWWGDRARQAGPKGWPRTSCSGFSRTTWWLKGPSVPWAGGNRQTQQLLKPVWQLNYPLATVTAMVRHRKDHVTQVNTEKNIQGCTWGRGKRCRAAFCWQEAKISLTPRTQDWIGSGTSYLDIWRTSAAKRPLSSTHSKKYEEVNNIKFI